MAQITPPTLILALLVLLTTFTTYLSGTPPNPTPYNSTQPDSLRRAVSPRALFIRRAFTTSLGLYHAVLTLLYPTPPTFICPHPSHLSPALFTPSLSSTLAIGTILLGSYIRLSAFSALGKDFTFRLAKPRRLVKGGLYAWVQHPSYVGKVLVIAGNWALVQSPSAGVGCWLPAGLVGATWFWRVMGVLLVLVVVRMGRKRVREEEQMLKETFGEEWEKWHAATSRFVPGVF